MERRKKFRNRIVVGEKTLKILALACVNGHVCGFSNLNDSREADHKVGPRSDSPRSETPGKWRPCHVLSAKMQEP